MKIITKHLIILGLLNIPVFLGLGKLIFSEWINDWRSTAKLFVFAALCAAVVYGEHKVFFEGKPGSMVSQLQPNQPFNFFFSA